jgi:peptidoglycan hydrolase-like protein with peptidoglycan-binding domain
MPPSRSTQTDADPAAPPAATALDDAMFGVLAGYADAALDPTDAEAVAHAVADFQTGAGLEATGHLDGSTIEALVQAAAAKDEQPERGPLKRGDTGQAVMDLQRLIVAPLTGAFDADTERRVRRVQSAAGLEVTGEVDAATWDAAEAKAKS